MPLLLQHHISENTKLAIWKIEEDEVFFLQRVQLQNAVQHPHKRLQHLAGRYLLTFLQPHFPIDNIEIANNRKPFLPSGDYQFSISHCGHYAAAIISSRQQVGIDIEIYSSKTEKVKHKFLSDDEQNRINIMQTFHKELFTRYQLYTLCWCAKEAVYKWWGKGEIDFKKNITIQRIDIDQNEISISFNKEIFCVEYKLHFLLLPELSVVWAVTQKIY